MKVADPLGYNITEMVIPDNALYCGLLKERQTYVSAECLLTSDAMIHFTVLDMQLTFCQKPCRPQVHESNSKSSAQGDAGWSNKLLTTMILVVAAVIFS